MDALSLIEGAEGAEGAGVDGGAGCLGGKEEEEAAALEDAPSALETG